MRSLLAAVHDRDADDAVVLVFVIVGLVLIAVGAWRAYKRDGLGAAIAGLFGLVLLATFWDDADL